jgi:hypothetical protein
VLSRTYLLLRLLYSRPRQRLLVYQAWGKARADRVSNRRFRCAPSRRANLACDVSSAFVEATLVGFERETLTTVVMKN